MTTERNPVIEAARMAKVRAGKDAKRAARAAEAAAAPPRQEGVAPPGIGHNNPPEPVHQPMRAPMRQGRVEVIGRNGELLSRSRTAVGDAFDVPRSEWPQGWEYQWNAVSVHGSTDVVADQNSIFYANGWRPVPAERYAGRYVPQGAKGAIIKGHQRLEERPAPLCVEAREQDIRLAKQLISDRNESLKLSGMKKGMADGFEMNSGKYRGTGGDIRMSIDRALDAPAPKHQIVGGDE